MQTILRCGEALRVVVLTKRETCDPPPSFVRDESLWHVRQSADVWALLLLQARRKKPYNHPAYVRSVIGIRFFR
jgi:hypothetical protein